MRNLHLLKQTFSQAQHASGTHQFNGLGTPLTMNGVEPYAYLRDLFTRLANGHLARDIDDLMPSAYKDIVS
jgi:hypothetical protein